MILSPDLKWYKLSKSSTSSFLLQVMQDGALSALPGSSQLWAVNVLKNTIPTADMFKNRWGRRIKNATPAGRIWLPIPFGWE